MDYSQIISNIMDYNNYRGRCLMLGKTPTGVAVACGISKNTITRWKQGTGKPSIPTLYKLDRYLKEQENPVVVIDEGNINEPSDSLPDKDNSELSFILSQLSKKNKHKLLAYAYELEEEEKCEES